VTPIPGLVWDACGLLNLMATRREREILAALCCPSYVVNEVRQGEVLELRDMAADGTIGDLVRVDTDGLVNSGLLREVSLEVDENATFIEFAAVMDDGEARSAAVCTHRGLWLVTDDRVCIREVTADLVQPITTPGVMKHWADAGGVDPVTLGESLKRIEICARYRPGRTHPLHQWWEDARSRV
jgi:hypothetical protein